MRLITALVVTLSFLISCKQQSLESIPTFTEKGTVNVVVEIPNGTNKKLQYDKLEKSFRIEEINGKKRSIDFLSYPGNYGFIPGTKMKKEFGGDGDAFDALILCESLPTSTVMEVIPLGIIQLDDNGEIDYKLVGIPADRNYQTIKARTLSDLQFDYPAIPNILDLWFTNYKGFGKTKVSGWIDEVQAVEEIKKWQTKSALSNQPKN